MRKNKNRFHYAVLFILLLFPNLFHAREYVVQKGDYLVKIARQQNCDWRQIQQINQLKNPHLIYPGQLLQLPDEKKEETKKQATDEQSVEKKEIVILGTSDIHANLYSFSYEDDQETKKNGLARVNSYVEEQRKQHKNVILIDNGDTIQGTIMSDDLYNKGEKAPHPVIKAMNFMKYDAMSFGNHEFNFGQQLIDKIVEEADFPILGANILVKETQKIMTKPYTIIEKDGIKIGLIGVVTPKVPRWDGEKVDHLEFLHMGETVKKYADQLRKDGCDLIIALAHAGITPEYDLETGSDGAESIAKFADIDGLLVGHLHTHVVEEINGVPIGGPKAHGEEVVQFLFQLEVAENQPAKIIHKEVDVIEMSAYEPSQSLRDVIKNEHEKTIDFIKSGITTEDGKQIGGNFGIATQDFQPIDEIKGIPQGRLQDTAVLDLIHRVQLDASGADVSAAALFKDDSNVLAGDINYSTIFNIYKFDNTLYTVEVSGKELKEYMEWSASYYNQWKEGDISISFNPAMPGYLYDTFEGVEYKIDLSKEVGNRITDLRFKGKALDENQKLILCVNNYRYASTLKGKKIVSGTRIWESPCSIRDYLVEYIIKEKEITPFVSGNWEIIGIQVDHPKRKEIIEMVNRGELDLPYHESLNIKELNEKKLIP